MTEAFETACFGIITYVGTARSCFVNAVQCAKQGDFEAAQEQIRQGDEAFTEGHHIHADLLAQDANGELNESGLIPLTTSLPSSVISVTVLSRCSSVTPRSPGSGFLI